MSYLRRVGVMSLAKFFALWGAVVGFILAIVPSIAFIVVGFSNSMNGASLGLLSLILFPLLYAICGFIGGAVTALLYNLVAKWTGGVEIEIEKKA